MPEVTATTEGPNGSFYKQSNRLILCFDGTGNKFAGTSADSNIVKLYHMFDRSHPTQMHYYQPGIGTYPAEGPVNVNPFRALMRRIEAVLDQALATSFDSHVIAGYKFIMRNYRPGDRIYVFGFSRGAYTARFLARMISHIGLLSVGNDELVPFAYQVYQEYEQNRDPTPGAEGTKVKFMNKFKKHFCRTDQEAKARDKDAFSDNESGIKVHFLGLFDCVSSVGNLDVPFFQKTIPLPAVSGTAKYVRHAVAIDERRVKFKAALFSQEQDDAKGEDIKEVWFPGNHGDVGGGWEIKDPPVKDPPVEDPPEKESFQLSDIALKWMVDEVDAVEAREAQMADKTDKVREPLAWDLTEKDNFLNLFEKKKDKIIKARLHDTLSFYGGLEKRFEVLMWKFMEYIPFLIKRWEFVETYKNSGAYIWRYIGWGVNAGGRRDIPSTALFHSTVLRRMRLSLEKEEPLRPPPYEPDNALWVAKPGDGPVSVQTSEGKTFNSVARNLKDLVPFAQIRDGAESTSDRHPPSDGSNSNSPRIFFEPARDATLQHASAKGKKDDDWDLIYRVAME